MLITLDHLAFIHLGSFINTDQREREREMKYVLQILRIKSVEGAGCRKEDANYAKSGFVQAVDGKDVKREIDRG